MSTSCSLLHVPLDLNAETSLPRELAGRLAFARQKVDEVVALGRALSEGPDAIAAHLGAAPAPQVNKRVRARLDALGSGSPRGAYAVRRAAQADGLPLLPTTTIGSFPQTEAIRNARADHSAGRSTDDAYTAAMRAEIDRVIALQEDIGEPITVSWASYAKSRTKRPVKGMLTGPVTMLAWSFVRADQSLGATARQVALALRDEIADLEAAGIRIIQVDEPALRVLLPLRRAEHESYLDWAVGAFRLATSGAADSTQIHTHMCYAEFGEIIGAIADLDADVTSIEAARSRMEFLADLQAAGYERGIGPGVWDIHSPVVPTVADMTDALSHALKVVEPGRLWANPDCGRRPAATPRPSRPCATWWPRRVIFAAPRSDHGTLGDDGNQRHAGTTYGAWVCP